MSQPSIPRSAAAALALSLCAASASAQVIVVGPAAGAIAQVPANGPMALALLLGALLLAAWWQLRRGPAAQRVLAWLAVVALGAAMHSGGLLALPFNSFTNPAGETRPIPVFATLSGADFTGFQQAEFTNQSGTTLRVTGLVPPSLGQCFTGLHSAEDLLQPGTPSASPTPVCQVGTVLANGDACRVDVDAICRGLLGPAPALTGITPGSGPATGGTAVTLTGSNLGNALGVSFDGVPGTLVTVVSGSQVTAVAPAHAAGVVNVAVHTPAGTARLANNGFTYVAAAPFINSASPAAGPAAGGTTVTLGGGNFTGATAVSFGGTPAASFIVASGTQITAVTPAHAAGVVDVVVTTPGGSATATNAFTYGSAPAITNVTPGSGSPAGGTSVVLTGSSFTGATAVSFGGTPAASFTVVSGTQITAVTPAHAAGVVDVVVTTPGGSATAASGFAYTVSVGDAYGGGVIYRISGSTAYIISPGDVATSIAWDLGPASDASTSMSNTFDTGTDNTYGALGGSNFPAAEACRNYAAGSGVNTWFLPARNEWSFVVADIATMNAKSGTSGFTQFGAGFSYWTSTELNDSNARTRFFLDASLGAESFEPKSASFEVRCVRALTIP